MFVFLLLYSTEDQILKPSYFETFPFETFPFLNLQLLKPSPFETLLFETFPFETFPWDIIGFEGVFLHFLEPPRELPLYPITPNNPKIQITFQYLSSEER